jgi:RNA polymerase sigma-70 factor (ECF subfamily)
MQGFDAAQSISWGGAVPPDDAKGRREQVMRLALDHRAQLWGFLMGLTRSPQLAEDLFQNTHVVICAKWEQFQPGTSFLAWARQIARYEFLAAVDPGRRPFVTAEMGVLESAMAAAAPAAEPAAASERREALRECLRTMPDRGQQALALRYGEGLDGGAVARKMGVSLNALYTLLSRVRKMLFECVERRMRSGQNV